jgi:hypothetical protein
VPAVADARDPAPPDLLARALAYAVAGVPVFPCAPGAKSPITAHGFHDATTDPARIRAWWTATPAANVAAPTGSPGFDVLDVDVRADGSGWAALRRAQMAGLLEGWLQAVRTPSGGLHLHYPGTGQRNGSIRGQHLDFRGHGGYVLLPPSRISTPDSLRCYEVAAARSGPGRPLDWAAIGRLLAPAAAPRPAPARPTAPGLDPTQRLAAHVARQAEGNRDNALFWAACRASEAGARDLTPLLDAAIAAGLPERQARRTIRSAQDTTARTPLRQQTRVMPPSPSQHEPPIRSAS